MRVLVIGCVFSALLSTCVKADTLIGQDKLNHFAVSASVASLTTKTHGLSSGMVLALLPGIAKEVSDLDGSGTPSVKDMAANFAGVIAASFLPNGVIVAPIAPRGVVEGAQVIIYGDL